MPPLITGVKWVSIFNDFAYDFMEKMELPEKFLNLLKEKDFEESLNGEEMNTLLENLFPDPTKQKKNRKKILEATAIAAYQTLSHALSMILTDEAPQFNEITERIGSC